MKCLKCGIDTDRSFQLIKTEDKTGWSFFKRKITVGSICRSCALEMAKPHIERLELDEQWMDSIR